MPKTTSLCYAFSCYAVLCGVAVGGCESGIKPTATITAADTADQVLIDMSHYMTTAGIQRAHVRAEYQRSEEHTSELQSRFELVCRLLLEKKNVAAVSRWVTRILDLPYRLHL